MITAEVSVPPSPDPLVTASSATYAIDGGPNVTLDTTAGPKQFEVPESAKSIVFTSIYKNKYGKPSAPSNAQSFNVSDLIPSPAAPSGVSLRFVAETPDPAPHAGP